jgi:hypothetical protein
VLGVAEPVKPTARRHSVAGLVPVRLIAGVGVSAKGPCLEIHLAGGEGVASRICMAWIALPNTALSCGAGQPIENAAVRRQLQRIVSRQAH